MNQNTPQLWDHLWKINTPEEDIYCLTKEEYTVRWRKIKDRVEKVFGSFSGLKVIEIGAGAGTYAALMARQGAEVTILDYSARALDKAKIFFERNQVKANFILQDALNLPSGLLGKYDVSMSFGLTEHFLGEQRLAINRIHLDVLKPGGVTFISVPNKYSPPYRLYKFVAQLTGKWLVGEEYPYSRRELFALCRKLKTEEGQVFGESLRQSGYFMGLLNPWRLVNKFLLKRETVESPAKADISDIKPERPTIWDDHLSYALVLYARKPAAAADA
ncbi:class I SAM-dependent methyltransferase [candidate division TA06 bacterium]|nr:class I SAM-dependent methyltransferase [candidate division TA06 bacterium]